MSERSSCLDMARLGTQMRIARLRAGKTAAEVSREIGKADNWLSRVELGDRGISAIDWIRWVDAIHATPEEMTRCRYAVVIR